MSIPISLRERSSRGRSEVNTMPMHPHAQPNFRNLFWYPFKITLITALRTFPFIGKRFGKKLGAYHLSLIHI